MGFIAFAAVSILFGVVHGHGIMNAPEPRAIRTMNLDPKSSAGWPYDRGMRLPCLEMKPDSNLQTIPFGKSKIKMHANDGANHVGPCKVWLVNPADNTKTLQVGDMKNCMRSLHPGPGQSGQTIPAEMEIDIPQTNLPCEASHCILRFDWTAEHMLPTIEKYDSCADVRLGGITTALSANSTSQPNTPTTSSPVKPTTVPPVTLQPNTPTTSSPIKPTTVPSIKPVTPQPSKKPACAPKKQN